MHRIISFLVLASAAQAADAIYINGAVITVDPAKPYAEAFAVTNGRFSAIGGPAGAVAEGLGAEAVDWPEEGAACSGEDFG